MQAQSAVHNSTERSNSFTACLRVPHVHVHKRMLTNDHAKMWTYMHVCECTAITWQLSKVVKPGGDVHVHLTEDRLLLLYSCAATAAAAAIAL